VAGLITQISAVIAGLAVGPIFWSPISKRFCRAAVIFWSMILTLCINLWSAEMTKQSQYNAFVVSRLFGGLRGSAPTTGIPPLKPVCIIDGPDLTFPTVGSNVIVETFFLHDRGKCFVIYTCCILLGTAAANTFSGFVVETASWTIQFWYNVGLEGVVAILCLVFLDETGWTRPGGDAYPIPLSSFLPRKLAPMPSPAVSCHTVQAAKSPAPPSSRSSSASAPSASSSVSP
jgi:MFS family permease